jgi:hypothetical protein
MSKSDKKQQIKATNNKIKTCAEKFIEEMEKNPVVLSDEYLLIDKTLDTLMKRLQNLEDIDDAFIHDPVKLRQLYLQHVSCVDIFDNISTKLSNLLINIDFKKRVEESESNVTELTAIGKPKNKPKGEITTSKIIKIETKNNKKEEDKDDEDKDEDKDEDEDEDVEDDGGNEGNEDDDEDEDDVEDDDDEDDDEDEEIIKKKSKKSNKKPEVKTKSTKKSPIIETVLKQPLKKNEEKVVKKSAVGKSKIVEEKVVEKKGKK